MSSSIPITRRALNNCAGETETFSYYIHAYFEIVGVTFEEYMIRRMEDIAGCFAKNSSFNYR